MFVDMKSDYRTVLRVDNLILGSLEAMLRVMGCLVPGRFLGGPLSWLLETGFARE